MSEKSLNTRKKKVKIGIIIFFSFAILIAALSLIDFEALYLKLSGPVEMDVPSYSKDQFYPSDYYTNIMDDPVYTELDRALTWSENGLTEKLLDNDYMKYKEAGELVHRYFRSLINGDADSYNALFTEEYKKQNGTQPNFTMQRVYDMKAIVLERSEDNIGAEHLIITLEYKIQRNDGTLRNDVLSDECVPIDVKVIIPAGGSAQIQSVVHYYDGNSLEYPSLPIVFAVLLLAIPVLMIAGFVILVVVIVRKKKKNA